MGILEPCYYYATRCRFLILCLVFFASTALNAATCYEISVKLLKQRTIVGAPDRFKASGTEVELAHAFEKEGLHYQDIHTLFNRIDEKGKEELSKRFEKEQSGQAKPVLTKWLQEYPTKWRKRGKALKPTELRGKTPKELFDYLLSHENPLDLITIAGIDELFQSSILNYDWLRPGKDAPPWLTVVDDLGSYEVKSAKGTSSRDEYQSNRNFTEDLLDGHIGHKHTVHAWPDNAEVRKEMAGKYVDAMDAATWFLFWRSANRSPKDPDDAFNRESIIEHPYLGVHNRDSLNRNVRAVEENDPKKFNNKFRMLGARNVKADPSLSGQEGRERLPDWETRSGNKNDKMREFFEDSMESVLISGDYSHFRDFRDYDFDASAPTRKLVSPHLTESEIAQIEKLEQVFPMFKHNADPRALNHFRNKMMSPLLEWTDRLPLDYKKEIIERAQKRYAKTLVEVANTYLEKIPEAKSPYAVWKVRREALNKIDDAVFRFARRVRLDQDFEHYIAPKPKKEDIPSVLFENESNGKRIDVNEIDLGIEYSFRFPDKPKSKRAVEARIKTAAETFAKSLGNATVEKIEDGGHGHGLSVRYKVTDQAGNKWRVEWDGISRTYDEQGKPKNPRGGHLEVPTPKSAPQDTKAIENLYTAMRSIGMHPKRAAGGAHVNFDLAPLKKMPKNVGPRMLVNLINVFESNREMVGFLWQHPFRKRVALPVELTPELTEKLNSFNGNWEELAIMLYQNGYYNPYDGRKPVYTQMNVAALFADILPQSYKRSIDIKKPKTRWFPSFDKEGDKGEWRLFDAPPDEVIAALQVKYARALFNKAFNGDSVVKYEKKFDWNQREKWLENPDLFIADAKKHFEDLELNFDEFMPLVAQARNNQMATPRRKPLPDKGKFQDPIDPRSGNPLQSEQKPLPGWLEEISY